MEEKYSSVIWSTSKSHYRGNAHHPGCPWRNENRGLHWNKDLIQHEEQ